MAERTSVRPLVRYWYKDGADTGDNRFTTLTSGRVIETGPGVDIIGFAQFPANTNVGSFEEPEPFRQRVETLSQYAHWKPDEPAAKPPAEVPADG